MNYTTMSKDSIQYLCGLIRNLANVSEGIDDLNLRSDGTFSSVKINTLLNTLKTDCNEHTDRLVANLSRLELKLVTDESDITDSNMLYLYKPDGATSYNQYVVIDGTKVLLGTCDIDMGDYYTISQANDKFALKINIDTLTTSFNNLVTSVENKIDKDDIVTVLDDTVTDDEVASARLVYEELDKKIEGDNVVKKDDIVTVLDNTVTDEQVASAKAMHTEFSKGFNGILQEGTLQVPNNDMNELTEPYCYETVIDTSSFANFPPVKKGITRFKLKVEIISSNTGMYRQEIEFQAGAIGQGTWYRN